MKRDEFSNRIKLAAYERSGGVCEHIGCGMSLAHGRVEFHHITPAAWGGPATLNNCLAICRGCHKLITRDMAPKIAKATRVRKRHLGIKRKSRPIPGSKASGWRKRMNGTWERRP